MATIIDYPTPHLVEVVLRDALEHLGVSPLVLAHWKITVVKNPIGWCYEITLWWRNYRIRESFGKYDLQLRNTNIMSQMAHSVARHLYKFNAAKDEEHMEALVLLSMRPTNESQNQQL